VKKQYLCTAVLAAIMFNSHALADDNADIEKIDIIGQRQAYQGAFEYKEVPAAVQEIDLELIKNAGALNLNEALDLSASVARQNNFGGLWNSFAIRGFAGDENLPSGFLVNGFNAGRGFGGPRDLVGVERVEVLKGPKAALFGRGEPGGAINLVTKRPTFSTGGEFSATYGSWEQVRLEADFQTVAGEEENVGIRVVGFFDDAESFRETVQTKRTGFYPSIAWAVSDQTSMTYELEFTRQEIPFDRGVVAIDGELGRQPIETFVGEPGDGDINTEVVGHQFEISHDFSDNWSLLAGLGIRDTTFEGLASETNFAGRQTLFIDPEQRTLSRFQRFRNFDTEYMVLRAELAGEFETSSLSHRLIVGTDYDKFENDQVILRYRPPFFSADTDINDLDLSLYLPLDILNPVYGQVEQFELSPNLDRLEVQEAWGIYIQDQINISENFQIRLGGRFDNFEQDIDNRRASPVTTASQSDTRFSPQFGAVYLFNEGMSVYASYGEGFRQLTGSDFAGNPFSPNQSDSAEIGFKAELSRLFENVTGSLTVSVFNINQSNILVFDDSPEAADGFFLTPGGEAESKGLEVDLNAQFADNWELWFSYAFIDAESTNDTADPNFVAPISAGDPLINVPENQLNIQLTNSLTLANMPATFGAGLLYVDERLGQTGTDFFLPSYTTVRAFAQIEPFENVTVRLDIDNLFDEEFYTNSFAEVWVEPGAPQRFRLSASLRF
jgi:iron complex outermembrane receptor protein